jgi:nicotinamide mononucleotide transporter
VWEPAISDPTAHAIGLGLGVVVWPLATVGLRKWSAAERPGLDVFTTVGSLLATYWMVANDPWNWWYWVVVNAAAIVLYARSGLVWGTALQCIYLVLALEGLFNFLPWP